MARLVLVAAFLFVPFLAASAQDKKDTPKGQLPTHWGKLGLSDEQKTKVYSIQAEYKTQIADLQKQIDALKKKEREALNGVLTDAQRARLKEILAEIVPGAKPDSKPKPDK
jgi:Spy/CpxP family protein refolding chaperone